MSTTGVAAREKRSRLRQLRVLLENGGVFWFREGRWSIQAVEEIPSRPGTLCVRLFWEEPDHILDSKHMFVDKLDKLLSDSVIFHRSPEVHRVEIRHSLDERWENIVAQRGWVCWVEIADPGEGDAVACLASHLKDK